MPDANNPVSADVQKTLARARDAQEPRTGSAPVSGVIATETMLLTHANTVVPQGHPDGAFVLVRQGASLPQDLADELGLTRGTAQIETVVVPDMALPKVPTETQTRPTASAPPQPAPASAPPADAVTDTAKTKP